MSDDPRVITISDEDHQTQARPTRRFLGQCPQCELPSSYEITKSEDTGQQFIHRNCLQCDYSGLLKLERIWGTLSFGHCDVRCMGATGLICNCQCGGINHAGAWRENRYKSETTETAVKRLQAQREAEKKRRVERAERKVAKKREEFQNWLATLWGDDADAIEWVRTYEPEGREKTSSFLEDMQKKLRQSEILTNAQTDALTRSYKSTIARRQRVAEEAKNAKPVPTGRLVVRGEIVHRKIDTDPYTERSKYKILIKGDGWKIWGTCPKDLINDVWPPALVQGRPSELPKGLTIEMTATIKCKGDDESFGIFSRPRGAKIVDEPKIPGLDVTLRAAKNYANHVDPYGNRRRRNPEKSLEERTIEVRQSLIGAARVVIRGERSGQRCTIERVNGITETWVRFEDGALEKISSSNLMLPENYKSVHKTPSAPQSAEKPAPKGETPVASAGSSARRSGSHAECSHPATKGARAKCRRERAARGE